MPSPIRRQRRSISEVASDWLGAATDVLNRGLVAGVVGAPVDIASTVLRPFIPGIGESPVGGSEWIGNKMQQAGMVSSKRRPIAEFAASLIDPATAPAAIAKSASLGAAKLSMLPLVIGQTVWHGSPHKFDKFDSSKIGTGEGAQAYGYGMYLAESPKVAREYAEKLSRDGIINDAGSEIVFNKTYDKSLKGWLTKRDNKRTAAAFIKEGGYDYARKFMTTPEDIALLNSMESEGYRPFSEIPNLYKVDIPDEAVARFLDWDKPLSQQPKEVQDALSYIDKDMWHPSADDYDPSELGQQIYQRLMYLKRDGEIAAGRNANTTLGASQAGASSDLSAFGIPGIRYLDGGSRGTGQGTSNFVVFPGNEGLLTILERNGVPIVPEPK